MVDVPKPEPTRAERHRDEIQGIIDVCEAGIMPHKAIAHWREDSGIVRPVGHSPSTVAQAARAISAARARCSKDIAAACERHRAEANAPPTRAAKAMPQID